MYQTRFANTFIGDGFLPLRDHPTERAARAYADDCARRFTGGVTEVYSDGVLVDTIGEEYHR